MVQDRAGHIDYGTLIRIRIVCAVSNGAISSYYYYYYYYDDDDDDEDDNVRNDYDGS